MNAQEFLQRVYVQNLISNWEEELAECEAKSPFDWEGVSECSTGLGHAYSRSFEITGSLRDLSTAIAWYARAMEVIPLNNDQLPGAIINHAKELLTRFEKLGSVEDLNLAITELEQAVARAPAPHIEIAKSNLAIGLMDRFKLLGKLRDVNRATALAEDVVRATPRSHERRVARVVVLASMLMYRYKATSSLQDLDASIELYQEAIDSTPVPIPNSLSISRTGDIGDGLRQPVVRRGYLSNLGDALLLRFMHKMSQKDVLDSGLGVALKRLNLEESSNEDDELNDLYRSIAANVEAVTDAPVNNPDRPQWLTNYANSLQCLYRHGQTKDPVATLDKAIQIRQDVIALTPDTHPTRATRLNNLSSDLHSKFLETGDFESAKLAAKALKLALDLTTESNPDRVNWLYHLGVTYEKHFEKTKSIVDYQNAVSSFTSAANTSLGAPTIRIQAARRAALALPYLLFTQGGSKEPFLSPPQKSADGGDNRSETKYSEIKRRAQLLRTAIELLPSISSRTLSLQEQQAKILQFRDLTRLGVAYSVINKDTPYQTLQLLELGRGIITSLQLDTRIDIATLEEKYPEYSRRFKQILAALDPHQPVDKMGYLPINPGITSQHKAAVEFDELVKKIRSLNGFERFLLSQSEAELKSMASHGPMVVFNISVLRADAIIVTKDEIICLPLPQLKYIHIEDNTKALLKALDSFSPRTAVATHHELKRILEWLWDQAVEPVLTKLGYIKMPAKGEVWPRVWWIASGWFNQLPIHAAGYHDDNSHRNTLDRVISSYAPTIKSLSFARQRQRRTVRSSTTQRHHNAVFVSMSETEDQATLINASTEIETVQSLFSNSSYRCHHLQSPTKADLKSKLQHSPIAHLACHGESNPKNPLQSQLLLKDYKANPFTVSDIIGMNLKDSQFAFLSACHTASGRLQDMLDENMHIAGAFQLAGFSHVIGTLWWIKDSAAVELARDVYLGMLDEKGEIRLERSAWGLHQAVRRMREATKSSRQKPAFWASYIHMGA